MTGGRVGAALCYERLRSAQLVLVLLVSAPVMFVAGVLVRRSDPAGAIDNVLAGAVFGFALPVLSYVISERSCESQSLDRAVDGVTRYGASRRAAMFGVLSTSCLVSACLSALLAALAVSGAHVSGEAIAFDLRSSVGIAFLSGVAYTACFSAASLLGKQGRGRTWALLADFTFGAGSTSLSIMFPRAHIRNLLGGTPPLGLTQVSAWFALVLMGVACAAVSLRSTAD